MEKNKTKIVDLIHVKNTMCAKNLNMKAGEKCESIDKPILPELPNNQNDIIIPQIITPDEKQ